MLIFKKSILKTAILLFFLGVVQILLFTEAFGQDEFDEFNEDDLFSDPQVIVEDDGLLNQTIDSLTESRAVSFSGSIYSTSTYLVKRSEYAYKTNIENLTSTDILGYPYFLFGYDWDWRNFDLPQFNYYFNKYAAEFDTEVDDKFSTIMTANILLDIRLPQGIKGFVNIDFLNYPQGKTELNIAPTSDTDQWEFNQETINSEYEIKEIFLDANINRRVYFRIGKQVIQWGRGFLFNPTDLINIEGKDFEDMDKNRLGVYGLKTHISFGSAINVYSFLDVGEEIDPDFFAYAGKIEFLLKNTEIGLSGWNKKNRHAIYGLDFSSQIGSVDIFGELSVSEKETIFFLDDPDDSIINPDRTISSKIEEWIPRASLGFMKSFDSFGKTDRIAVTGEIYYNDVGFSHEDLGDEQRALAFLLSGLYEPNNNLSKYYGALFVSYNDFFVNKLTFALRGLGNFADDSYIIVSQLTYNPVYDFTVQLDVISFIGDESSEYTFMGHQTLYQVEVRIAF